MVEPARRPVKDKGALMQTLHLRFRALRAISPGQSPSRWQTPSMQPASTWKGGPPLPNHPKPTLAVGSPSVRRRNSPPESFREAASPSRQRPDRCPTAGAGLPLASPFREAHGVGPYGAAMCRVCPRQTASALTHDPAPHEAGDHGSTHGQARASAILRTPSFGLSFPLRPRRCGARASGEKTADPVANAGASAGVSSGARRRCGRALRQRPSSAGG